MKLVKFDIRARIDEHIQQATEYYEHYTDYVRQTDPWKENGLTIFSIRHNIVSFIFLLTVIIATPILILQ